MINENDMTWQDLKPGCIVVDGGNTALYKTGDWKSQRPTYTFERCLKCGLCTMYCPEGCINKNKDGFYEADLFYCKGCGICARECPAYVIKMEEEA